MSLHRTLAKARELVASGWVEPMCQSIDGRWVNLDSEDAARFDVDSALLLSAETQADYLEARTLLEGITNPATRAFDEATADPDWMQDSTLKALGASAAAEPGSLAAWLEKPSRTLGHVLWLFDKALLASRAREAA